jgi:hypothetical protein
MKENAHFQVYLPGNAHPRQSILVSGRPAALADSIGINCSATATHRRSDQRALLAAGDPANQSTRAGSTCGGQFVSVLLPKAATVPMSVPDAGPMRVISIAVSVPQPAAPLRRHRDFKHNQESE